MQLEIITPEKRLFEGECTSVQVPGTQGSMGFLNNHAALITTLQAGTLSVKTADGDQSFEISGGVVDVMNNKGVVLVEQ